MEMEKKEDRYLTPSYVRFHWRSTDKDPDLNTTSKFAEAWRKYDKLIALIICVLLTRFYDCKEDESDQYYFQAYWTRCYEIVVLAVVSIATYVLLKVRNPDIFFYDPDNTNCQLILQPSLVSSDDSIQDGIARRYVGTQTDRRNYEKETRTLERRHRREMLRLSKMRRLMRRKISHQLKDASIVLNERRHKLADLQLQLLPLASRQEALLAEKETLETDLKEEQIRYSDLMARFERISHQMSLMGAGTPTVWHTGYQYHCDIQGELTRNCGIDIGGGDPLQYDGNQSAQIVTESGATQSVHVIQSREHADQLGNIDSILGENGNTSPVENEHCLCEPTSKRPSQIPRPVRILYATECGDDGLTNYRQVTSDMYHVYTEGAGLLPKNAKGQMEVIAEPHADGTLKLQYVKQYVDGFPVDKLGNSDMYQTFDEFRESVGRPVPNNWSPSDVQFHSH